jgi:hypothetical protein
MLDGGLAQSSAADASPPSSPHEAKLAVTFVEICGEKVYDLLRILPARQPLPRRQRDDPPEERQPFRIREHVRPLPYFAWQSTCVDNTIRFATACLAEVGARAYAATCSVW